MLQLGGSLDQLAQGYENDHKPTSIPSYKPLEKTGEYEERTWYIDSKYDGVASYKLDSKNLVTWCSYWVDFALYLSNKELFNIDNNFSNEKRANFAFASDSILDLAGASVNEYLLCIALTQLSPHIISKQAVMGTVKGNDVCNDVTNSVQQEQTNMLSSSTSLSPSQQWSIISHNTTQRINIDNINTIPNTANFRYIRHTSPQYPFILLHKQVQQLKNDADMNNTNDNSVSTTANTGTTTTATTTTGRNTGSTNIDQTKKPSSLNSSLSVSQYYIDIFESIQKRREVYIKPTTSFFKRRGYSCKTVISNASSEPIKTKVLVTIPDGTTSLCYDGNFNDNSLNQTHLNYLQSRTIYCTIPSYSSHVIEYSFLLGNSDSYTHYGASYFDVAFNTNPHFANIYSPSLLYILSQYEIIA